MSCPPLGSLAAALWPFLARTHEAHLCWIYLLPPEAGRLPSSVFSGGPAAGPVAAGRG